ncbi:hypothetical protein HQ447_06910, partial [bacterium]|nr:hypothetical protein [bacterium]
MSRKTKIIITLGPATESEDMIGRLIDEGTNVFRLNMSHAKHEWAAEMAKRVRRQAEARLVHIAVLFDLTGPSIRTGDLEKPYNLLENSAKAKAASLRVCRRPGGCSIFSSRVAE